METQYDVKFDEERGAYTALFTCEGKHYIADLTEMYFMPSKPKFGELNESIKESWENAASHPKPVLAIFPSNEAGEYLSETELYEACCSSICKEEVVDHINKFIEKTASHA